MITPVEVALLSAVMKPAAKKLLSLIGSEFASTFGLKKDLCELQGLFADITAWMSAVEVRIADSSSSPNWLKQLKAVVNDFDDLLYRLEADKHKAKIASENHVMVNLFYTKPKSVVSHTKMVQEIKEIKKRFAKIVKQRTEFNAIASSTLVTHHVQPTHNTKGEMSILGNPKYVVGRDEVKYNIISMLLEADIQESISIVSIVGLGGSGKTTLAKYICQDDIIGKHFEVVFWVHVSQEFNVEKLIGKLFESLSNEKSELHTLQHMSKQISQKLSKRRFLLVLDDVWNENRHDWEQFEQHLNSGPSGSKILLTTRDKSVADAVKSVEVVNLAVLSDDDSWKLFQQSSGWAEEGLDSEFIEVGKEIVKKCAGMPLAIKSLAGNLHGKRDIKEWWSLRDSNLLTNKDIQHRVLESLKLSYFHLPDDLKQCVVLCCIFHKGYRINKEHLISLWIAHGFVSPSDGSRQLEDIGSGYFDSLLKVSFLQDLVEDNHNGRVKVTCKMHDLVHDLCRESLQNEILLTPKTSTNSHNHICRYLSLAPCSEKVESKLFSKLRALFVARGSFATDKPVMEGYCVRSVILEGLWETSVPLLISKFEYLGYLRISDSDFQELSEAITGCWNLQAIHVIRCFQFATLPESIGKLRKLRTLEVSETAIESLPESIGDCQNLESLHLHGCQRFKTVPDSMCKNENLRLLKILNCYGLQHLPSETFGLLRNINTINLSKCTNLKVLPDSFACDQLHTLKLTGLTKLTVLPQSITCLSNLEHLELQGCSGLIELPQGIVNLKRLVVLNLQGCSGLRGLPAGFGQLTRLETLGLFVIGESSKHARISELGSLDRLSGRVKLMGVKDPDDANKAYLKRKNKIHELDLSFRSMDIEIEQEAGVEQGMTVLNIIEPPYGNKTSIAMLGPCGGRGGSLQEIKVPSLCLNSITIRSGEIVYGLSFSYTGHNGNQHHGGPWGASWGAYEKFIDDSFISIQLGPSEFVTQISGTSGYASSYSAHVVTSITFITNARSYGPFGVGRGTPFHSPVMSCGSIVGIFARTGEVVDAIGLYVNLAEEPMKTRDLITKIGPWGGYSGTRNDLVVLPRRLISVVVRSGDVIDSLTFTYSDGDGQQHSAGPWEGSGASQDGTFHTILFGPSEFLKQVSGTIGPTNGNPDILTSLFFVTNTGKYGPFGGGVGIPFCSPVQENGSIVGFFAHVGKGVDAIGVYVEQRTQEDDDGPTCATSDLQDDIKELDKACIKKVGPWGGNKGNPNDIEVAPLHLSSITIRSGEVIYSIAFSYSDEYGKLHHAGPWGACEGFSYGKYDTIQLGPSEFLTEVSGTVGFSVLFSSDVVTSVTFITNATEYGPFGGGGGIPFHSPATSNGCIVGFFAHADRVVDAIGVYVNAERESKIKQVLITKVGPWGGNSGMPNDVDVLPRRLLSVVLHSGKVINSFKFTYSDCSEQQHTVGPWGTSEPLDGSFHTIRLGGSEILAEVSGTIGKSSKYTDVVTSLFFVTNTGSYGPYGKASGTPFQSPQNSNGTIVGFFANAGDVISSIGVYFNPKREIIIAEMEGGSRISDASSERQDIKSAYNVLEKILVNESAEPINLPLALLQHITDDFSDKRRIGRGGSGVIYKGDLQNGSIAVKRLFNSYTIKEDYFNSEATSLISVKHQNIVRFLGYCAITENKAILHPEPGKSLKHVFAEIRERLLCFEYIKNGSLDQYLHDELRGFDWHTRYQIIRGICDGLVYLHREKDIVHRDMKPANILLNDRMIPKITDFGISKLLDGATHAVTANSMGTRGYCPPELINNGEVSIKSDVYSLGVIIKEVVTGRKDNSDIKHVLRRWRYRWNKSSENPPLGYEQVTKCIEIALMCLSELPKLRPCVWDIVSMLNELESPNENVNIAEESPVTGPISPYPWEMLEFDKLELNFPFEINKQIPCSLQLTNVTDDYVAFGIEPTGTGILQYCVEPEKGVVSPRSKCNVMIELQARERAPHSTTCKDDFIIVRCAAVNGGLAAEDIIKGMFDSRSGKVVDEVMLKVIV